jgi:hypothetical protein
VERFNNEEVKPFNNDDESFRKWLTANRAGYVLNCYKATSPSGGPYMLHLATCYTLETNNLTTTQFYKVCSNNREKLINWAKEQALKRGYDELSRCTKCNP